MSHKEHPDGARPATPKPVPGAVQNLAFGPVPGWLVLVCVAVFYISLNYLTFRKRQKSGELAHGNVHV